jgi:hypothetical protein
MLAKVRVVVSGLALKLMKGLWAMARKRQDRVPLKPPVMRDRMECQLCLLVKRKNLRL